MVVARKGVPATFHRQQMFVRLVGPQPTGDLARAQWEKFMTNQGMSLLWAMLLAILQATISCNAHAAEACIPTIQGQQCSDYVSHNISPIHIQQTMVTCWAASLVNYLRFYGADVDEGEIVLKTGAGINAATPLMMQVSENNTYTDKASGRPVQVTRTLTYDGLWHSINTMNNNTLIQMLKNEIPVYYADPNHAMVLVGITYLRTPLGPQIFDALLDDPATGIVRHPAGFQELIGMYAAVLKVTFGGNSAPFTLGAPPNPPAQLPPGWSLKCAFTNGPRTGTVLDFSGLPLARPAPVGAPCTDGQFSFGLSTP